MPTTRTYWIYKRRLGKDKSIPTAVYLQQSSKIITKMSHEDEGFGSEDSGKSKTKKVYSQ